MTDQQSNLNKTVEDQDTYEQPEAGTRLDETDEPIRRSPDQMGRVNDEDTEATEEA